MEEKVVTLEAVHVEPIVEMKRFSTFAERKAGMADKKGEITFYHNLRTGKRSRSFRKVVENPDEVIMLGISRTESTKSGMIVTGVRDGSITLERVTIETGKVYTNKKISFIDLSHKYWMKNTNSEILVNRSGVYPMDGESRVYNDTDDFLQSPKILKNFFKEAGIKFVGRVSGNEVKAGTNIKALKDILSYQTPVKKTGTNQTIVDSLMKIELPDVPVRPSAKYMDQTMAIQKVPGPFGKEVKAQNICAIRTFYNDDGENVEFARVFVIDRKKTISCLIEDGEGIAISMSDHASHWDFPVYDFKEEEVAGTKLEYMSKILDSTREENRGILAYMFLKTPLFEILCKNGMEDFVEEAIEQIRYQNVGIKELIQRSLGIDTCETNLKKTGFSAEQIKYLTKFSKLAVVDFARQRDAMNEKRASDITLFWTNGLFNILKHYCPFESISDMDISTFKQYVDMMAEFYESARGTGADYGYGCQRGPKKDLDKFIETSIRVWGLPALISFYNNHKEDLIRDTTGCSRIIISPSLVDYVEAVMDTGLKRDFKLKYRDKDEFNTMHDNIMTAKNLMSDEIQAKKVNEALLRAKGLEYEPKKGQWVIIAPKSTEDIVTEGSVLNHCVARYVDKIVSGTTNILFIRDKDNIKRPFFTIEVTEYNEIRQVHGVNNRNVSTEPGLLAFVKEYARKKHLVLLDIDRLLA